MRMGPQFQFYYPGSRNDYNKPSSSPPDVDASNTICSFHIAISCLEMALFRGTFFSGN